MLTSAQKQALYSVGQNDKEGIEFLRKQARKYITEKLGGLKKLSTQAYSEAVELYLAGFYGEKDKLDF